MARDVRSGDREGAGEILELDRDARRLVLKRGRSLADVPLPEALIPGAPTDAGAGGRAERFGRSLLAGDRRYPALESILRREPFDRAVQTTDLDEMKELVLALDGRHLVIQGPPGSGKTWTSGRLIADLIAHGKTVGVASTSHKAIHNLLDAVERRAGELGLDFRGLKKASGGNPESVHERPHHERHHADECVGVDLTGGTAWLFARDAPGTLDYLFIDEAGQVSLADALAMGTAARNVVLVGDPQQLAQVIQGTHPAGTDASVLTYLLGDAATIPPDRGLFLERTFRLHPDVCGYISEEFYEGRLAGRRGRRADDAARDRAAVRRRRARRAPAGVGGGGRGGPRARRRAARAGVTDVLVVAPYNVQVNALAEALPGRARRHGRQVPGPGGRRRRLLDGELERRRRPARARVPALAQPAERRDLACALPRVPRREPAAARGELPQTIPQMRLANALCRFVELAQS